MFTFSIGTFIFYTSEFLSVIKNRVLNTPDKARKDPIALLSKLHHFEASTYLPFMYTQYEVCVYFRAQRLHVNLLQDTDIGVKPRKLWNVIRILLLESVTQLTCISSKDNLIEVAEQKLICTCYNWFLDKFTAVHKLRLRWRVPQHRVSHSHQLSNWVKRHQVHSPF